MENYVKQRDIDRLRERQRETERGGGGWRKTQINIVCSLQRGESSGKSKSVE